MGVQDILLTKLSRPSPLLIATTAATVFVVIPTLRLAILSRQLTRQITHHQSLTGDKAEALVKSTSNPDSLHSSILNTNDNDVDTSTTSADDHHSIISTRAVTFLPSPAALPTSLTNSPTAHNIFYDISLLAVPRSTLPPTLLQHPHDLLTAYLQHTMTLFANTPQGWILWAMAALSGDQRGRRSFEREWIESLGFDEGELVCGFYKVLETDNDAAAEGGGFNRTDHARGARVVFEMKRGPVEGRLVVAIRPPLEDVASVAQGRQLLQPQHGKGEGEEKKTAKPEHHHEEEVSKVVFNTETWMWVKKDAGVVMPMERTVPRFMHRLASWWLLARGTEWLQTLAR